MEDESSEYNYEQLRNMSVAERQERFRAFKKARVMSEVKKSTEVDHWQSIDDPMTSEQLDRLPPGHPDVDPQTPPVWVKFFHPWHREVMVSKGRFNYESGTWAARFQPKEEGNCWGEVTPSAWAEIVVGERPWDGPVIPDHVRQRRD